MLGLRRATKKDLELIFGWANDPVTRANSISTNEIPWDDHVVWMDKKLADPNCDLFVALDSDGSPAGLGRIDVTGSEAEIGVVLAPGMRGRGMGPAIVAAVASECFAMRDGVNVIVANIKPDNVASMKSFSLADFVPVGEAKVRGAIVSRYELHRKHEP